MIIAKRVRKLAEDNPNFWNEVLKRTFATGDGKLALLYLIQNSGMFSLPKSFDPLEVVYTDGRRSQILELLSEIGIDPTDIALDGESFLDNIEDRMGGEDE